jgi:hypothetical protein
VGHDTLLTLRLVETDSAATACCGRSRMCVGVCTYTCVTLRCRCLPASACRNYTSWKEDTGSLPGEWGSVGTVHHAER